MANSPYAGVPTDQWHRITQSLIERYPLSLDEIRDIAQIAWGRLWSSTIGGQINLDEVELPATVVGYFFQKLFAHELAIRYPGIWRGERDKSDKDLVNLQDSFFSTEMKSSGQMGYALFGNRSYNQQTQNGTNSSKDKSGFYITANFFGPKLTLLRLGWIDQDDWVPQGAETGQAAILRSEVYEYKLVEITGDYRRQGPVQLLNGVGAKGAATLKGLGIETISDIMAYNGSGKEVQKIKDKNKDFLDHLRNNRSA